MSVLLPRQLEADETAIATFAGGCFWCMEKPFEKLAGVKKVVSGYSGGHIANPTYEAVSAGTTGHVEAIRIFYSPEQISFDDLLDVFWQQIDPTDGGGQFVDRGSQYRSVIFYHDEIQKTMAEESRWNLADSGIFERAVITEIIKAGEFYPAEEYHQDYHAKNPVRYNFYRYRSGRERFLKKIWETEKGQRYLGEK